MIVTDKQYYMDGYLKENLDILKQKLVKDDWFFIIIISGSNRVRVGKSTIAQQISYYLDDTYDFQSLIFNSEKLADTMMKIGKGKVGHIDEGKEGFDSKRALESLQKDLMDFLSQAGQLNQFIILVVPEFFDLNKSIATSQSICLINCYCNPKNLFERGYFQFFNIDHKNKLYYYGKKQGNNYLCVKPNFIGRFTNYQILDRTKYNKIKMQELEFLKERQEKRREEVKYINKLRQQRAILIQELYNMGKDQYEIANIINGHQSEISIILKRLEADNNNNNPQIEQVNLKK